MPNTQEPKLWEDMTPEEKGALLLAHHEGKTIKGLWEGCWRVCDKIHKFTFTIIVPCRVKPELVKGSVTMEDINYGREWNFDGHKDTNATHRITFDLVDGKPDCNSIKMEEI